jgi:hypothetical protein
MELIRLLKETMVLGIIIKKSIGNLARQTRREVDISVQIPRA